MRCETWVPTMLPSHLSPCGSGRWVLTRDEGSPREVGGAKELTVWTQPGSSGLEEELRV